MPARVTGNCNLCISGDDGFPGLTLILANTGLIGTRLFSLAKLLDEFRIADSPALLSSNLTKIVEGLLLTLSTETFITVPNCPLISRSLISTLVVSITLAFSLIRILVSSPPVSDLPLDNTLSISCFLT